MNKVVIENLIPILDLIGVSAFWDKFFNCFLAWTQINTDYQDCRRREKREKVKGQRLKAEKKEGGNLEG